MKIKFLWVWTALGANLENTHFLIEDWNNRLQVDASWGWKIDVDKMHHITAKEAWRIAKKLKAKNLIIIHTKEIENRQQELKNDAKEVFKGNIIVPNDWDELILF